MQEAMKRVIFNWPKGNPHAWVLSVDRRARRGAQIHYRGMEAELLRSMWQPATAPKLYVEVAAIAAEALSLGATRHQASRAYVSDGPDPDAEQLATLWGATAPEIQNRVLDFSRAYGPLLHPDHLILRDQSDGVLLGFEVTTFLREAWRLYDVMRRIEARATPDFAADAEIMMQVNRAHRFISVVDDKGNLVPAMTYNDLAGLLWVQLWSHLSRGVMRICEGCGVVFVATIETQKFHDTLCRDRAYARRRYQAKKETA